MRLMWAGESSENLIDNYKIFHRFCLQKFFWRSAQSCKGCLELSIQKIISLPRFWRMMQSVYEMPKLKGEDTVQLGVFHHNSSEALGQGNSSLGLTLLPDHFLFPGFLQPCASNKFSLFRVQLSLTLWSLGGYITVKVHKSLNVHQRLAKKVIVAAWMLLL